MAPFSAATRAVTRAGASRPAMQARAASAMAVAPTPSGRGMDWAQSASAASSTARLKAAAAKKNDACQYVAAAVNLSVARGVPDKRAEEIRDALAGSIKNLALIES